MNNFILNIKSKIAKEQDILRAESREKRDRENKNFKVSPPKKSFKKNTESSQKYISTSNLYLEKEKQAKLK